MKNYIISMLILTLILSGAQAQDAQPEIDAGVREFEKEVQIRGRPEKTLLQGTIPKVLVRTKARTRRHR